MAAWGVFRRKKAKITKLPFSENLPIVTAKKRFGEMGFSPRAVKEFGKYKITPEFMDGLLKVLKANIKYLRPVEKNLGEGKVVLRPYPNGKLEVDIHKGLLGPYATRLSEKWGIDKE